MEDLDPDVDVEVFVASKNSNVCAEESNAGNSNNSKSSAKYGFASYLKDVSIGGVGGGCCNSIV